MNILMIARGFPTPNDIQWGCFERDQAIALRKQGHRVCIVSVDGRYRGLRWPFIKQEVIDDFEIYTIYLLPRVLLQSINKSLSYKVFSSLLVKLIKKFDIIKNFKPDIIYVHFLPNISFAHTLNQFNVPIIGVEHSSDLTKKPLNSNTIFLGKRAYSTCDTLLTVSKRLRNQILTNFHKDSVVIYNMVGEEFENTPFLPQPNENGIVRLVTTGSLIKRKGYDILIQALSILKKTNWSLTIIGEGKERRPLERLIEENSFQNKIFLVGKKNKKEIIQILLNSDVFVFPSRAENFSVAVIEALAMGLPVIASDCGGTDECIKDYNGKLVPPENVAKLSEAISEFLSKYDQYDRLKIRQQCLKDFGPENVAKKLTTIFKNVVNSKSE